MGAYAMLPYATLVYADEDESEEIGNILANKGFESGSLAPWAGYAGGSVAVQNCCAKKGVWSGKVTATNEYAEIYQTVSVKASRRYRLIAWVYTNGTTATLGWFSNVDGDHVCATTNATSYTKLICEFAVLAGTTNFNVHLSIDPNGTKFAVLDALKFVEFCAGPFCYAQWNKFGTYYGVWAIVETADPKIRDGVHQYTTIHVIDTAAYKFVEAGILKGPPTQCIPKFSWAVQPGSANPIPTPVPTIGQAYQIAVYRNLTQNGVWYVWHADLSGTPLMPTITVSNPGFNFGNRISAAGETHSPNHLNDMGIAGLRALKYMDAQGFWYDWNGNYQLFENRPYRAVPLPPDVLNGLQVSGNNGNPVPPGAPCP